MIGFACIESRFAAARTNFPERRTAVATLARAQGGTSPAEFTRPMSRRQLTQRRELSLLPPGPDWHSDVHQKRGIRFDSRVQVESCRLAAPVSCGIEEPPPCWIRKRVHNPAVMRTDQTADPPRAELGDRNGLFASLIFHKVRPRKRSAIDAGQRRFSSHDRKPGSVLVAAPDVRSQFNLLFGRPATIAQAGLPDPVRGPIETLFTELASRRLRSLAARKRA